MFARRTKGGERPLAAPPKDTRDQPWAERYLAELRLIADDMGDPSRQKVQGIVEGFTALQDQLVRERRAMEKLWKEREKQIERVITNTVGMYGEMSGILGASMPEIPALTLEAGLLGVGDDA